MKAEISNQSRQTIQWKIYAISCLVGILASTITYNLSYNKAHLPPLCFAVFAEFHIAKFCLL